MVVRVWEAVSRCPEVDSVHVAVDSEPVAAAVQARGGNVVWTGPAASGTDRIGQALQRLDDRSDWVLNVQGDEPLVDPQDLSRLIKTARARPTGHIHTLVRRADGDGTDEDPDRVKVALGPDGRALRFSRKLPAGGEGPAWVHVGVYLYRRPALDRFLALPPSPQERAEGLEQLRALEAGMTCFAVEARSEWVSIDRPTDVSAAVVALGRRFATEERQHGSQA